MTGGVIVVLVGFVLWQDGKLPELFATSAVERPVEETPEPVPVKAVAQEVAAPVETIPEPEPEPEVKIVQVEEPAESSPETPLSDSGNESAAVPTEEMIRAQLRERFQAPDTGSEITVRMAVGTTRTGIMTALTEDSVTLQIGKMSLTYKSSALHKKTRYILFADDYADARLGEHMRKLQLQRHLQHAESRQDDAQKHIPEVKHEGRIAVLSKVAKKSDRDVKEEEKVGKKTGETRTITTTTKTRSETPKLTVTIYNPTTHQDTYTLEWYCFAKPSHGDRITARDRGTEKITVGSRKRVRHDIIAKAMVTRETTVDRENANGHSQDPYVSETGEECAGYLVLLKHGDIILDRKASSKKYLTNEWLARL